MALPVRDLGFAAAVVVAVFIASPLHLPLNNPNEGVRVFAAKALVEEHTFAIENVQRAWGYIDDKSARDGHLYSSKAPLVEVLAAAGYAMVHVVTGDLPRPALTRVCRGFGDALPSLLCAFLLWRGLRRRVRDPLVADVVTLGSVLGTGALASMNVLSGHALAQLAPAAALVLVAAPAPSRRALVVAGSLLAVAAGAEYPAVLVCLPIAALAVFGQAFASGARRLALLALGAAPVVVVVSVAHTAMFGAPWRTGYGTLENHDYQRVVAGFFGIGAPDFGVLARVLVSPDVGLWFYSPFLLAGVLYAPTLVRRRDTRALGVAVIVACALMFAFIAGYRGWRGGWSVGPRYLSEVAGVLALPTALAFDALAARTSLVVARASLASLVAVSIVHSGIAGAFFPHLSDAFANPVYEMMLPLVGRGFAPDSVPLWLGMGARTSAVVVMVALFVPLAVAVFVRSDARGSMIALLAGLAAVVVAVLVGPTLAHSEPAAGSLEARRMMDNWRPDDGDPLLADGGASDVRTLVAVDRARIAWPFALGTSCAAGVAAGAVWGDLAPFANDVARFAAGALVVVPDRFAFDLAGVRTSPALFVVDADVQRFGRAGLPCAGDIWIMRGPREALPGPLKGHTELSRVDAGDELVWVRVSR